MLHKLYFLLPYLPVMIYNRVMDTLEELQLHGKTVFTINDASMLMKKAKKICFQDIIVQQKGEKN